MTESNGDATYPAGLLREFQRGDLEGLEPKYISEIAGKMDDADEIRGYHHLKRAFSAVDGWDLEDLDWHDTELRKSSDIVATRAIKDGNTSVMQNQIGLRDSSNSTSQGLSKLLPYITREAFICALIGKPTTGKTASSLYLGEEWSLKMGGELGTNVPITEDWRDMIEFIETEWEMKGWMKNRSAPTLFIKDELEDNDASAKNSQTNSKALSNLGRKIRKDPYNSAMIVIGHRWTDIPPGLRSCTSVLIEKKSKTKGEVYLDGFTDYSEDADNSDFEMKFPDTRVDYHEHKQPEFEFGESVEEVEENREMSKEMQLSMAQQMRSSGIKPKDIVEKESIEMSESWVYDHTDPDKDLETVLDEFDG
jgi:hypothetical protein